MQLVWGKLPKQERIARERNVIGTVAKGINRMCPQNGSTLEVSVS
jgi:hypothetical protein